MKITETNSRSVQIFTLVGLAAAAAMTIGAYFYHRREVVLVTAILWIGASSTRSFGSADRALTPKSEHSPDRYLLRQIP